MRRVTGERLTDQNASGCGFLTVLWSLVARSKKIEDGSAHLTHVKCAQQRTAHGGG
jgi:hypothetical protein